MNSPSYTGVSRLQTMRGLRMWNISAALAAVHSAVTTGAYTTGYALHLGATSALIGLLSAAPSWGQMLQALSPLFSERLRRRKPLCLIAYAFSYGMWLPVAVIPFIVIEALQPWALVVCIALAGAASALAAPASNSWMTDLAPREIRGRFVAQQQSVIAAVGLVTSLGAGMYLDLFSENTQQTGFTSLFVIAVFFALVSVWSWSRVPEPAKQPGGQESPLHLLMLPFRHKQFRTLMTLISVRVGVAMLAGPFFTVFMLRTLEIPYSQIALFSSMQTLANITMNPFWGYLADKFGYRPILLLCSTGLALFPLWWVFVTLDNYWIMVPLAQIWGGITSAGIPLAQFNLMIKTAPDANRSVYIGCYSAMTSAASALGAMLGGAAAAVCGTLAPLTLFGYTIADLQYLFLGGFILRLAAAALLSRVQEEAALSPRAVIEQMRSANPVATIWNLIRMSRSADPSVKARAARELGDMRSALAVDELIALLDDSDREVRREAALSLGRIGDERAVSPLLDKLSDPASDIPEETIEALGDIPSPLSLNILVTLLNDSRPSIRRSAVLALGRVADPRAQLALERLLADEKNRPIAMAVTGALSRMGDVRMLPRLERLLRDSAPGVERKTLAQSVGYVLGAPDQMYRILQGDGMTQDRLIARSFSSVKRRLTHWDRNETLDAPYYETHLDEGLQGYEQQDYGGVIEHLLGITERVLERLTGGQSRPDRNHFAPDEERGHPTEQAVLRLNTGFIRNLYEESRHRTLLEEELLLSIVAFQQVIDEGIRLTE